MIALLLPLIITLVKGAAAAIAFIAFKKYIMIGAALFGFYLLIRAGDLVLNFLKMIMENTVLKVLVGCSIVFGAGGFTGYKIAQPDKSEVVKELKVNNKYGKSQALIKNGKTYYSYDFINKYLDGRGLKNGHFKNME